MVMLPETAFDQFWAEYPKERRVKKFTSKQKFVRIVKDEFVFIRLLDWLKMMKASQQWRDPQFIPHPTTVLNQRRWEDDFSWVDEALKGVLKTQWRCDHEPRCGNRETCAVVSSRTCQHEPACSSREACLELTLSQWR